MSTANRIFSEALALDTDERTQLALELLESLGPPEVRGDEEENAELRRRAMRALREGSRGAPWPEVRALLERARGR